MKKLFAILFALFLTQFVLADNTEIAIDELVSKKSGSLVQKPIVFIDDVLFTLSIQFPSQGENYTISVTDSNGTEIAQYQVMSDFILQVFQLPILDDGLYRITLSNNSNNLIGNFEI